MQVEIQNELLLLSVEKIIYWEKESAILMADVHLGKSTHFRKAGIAVPNELIFIEIDKFKKLINKYHPKRIFFLGDLFHSHLNIEWQLFTKFLDEHSSVEFILIKGNHDILPDIHYQFTNLKVTDEPYHLNPFTLTHHPLDENELKKNPAIFNIAGHIHPGISIKGKGKSSIKMPCFHLKAQQLVLPAFGDFTGLMIQRNTLNESFYGIAGKKVILIK